MYDAMLLNPENLHSLLKLQWVAIIFVNLTQGDDVMWRPCSGLYVGNNWFLTTEYCNYGWKLPNWSTTIMNVTEMKVAAGPWKNDNSSLGVSKHDGDLYPVDKIVYSRRHAINANEGRQLMMLHTTETPNINETAPFSKSYVHVDELSRQKCSLIGYSDRHDIEVYPKFDPMFKIRQVTVTNCSDVSHRGFDFCSYSKQSDGVCIHDWGGALVCDQEIRGILHSQRHPACLKNWRGYHIDSSGNAIYGQPKHYRGDQWDLHWEGYVDISFYLPWINDVKASQSDFEGRQGFWREERPIKSLFGVNLRALAHHHTFIKQKVKVPHRRKHQKTYTISPKINNTKFVNATADKNSVVIGKGNYLVDLQWEKDNGSTIRLKANNSTVLNCSINEDAFDKKKEERLNPEGPQKDFVNDTGKGSIISSNVSKYRNAFDKENGMGLRSLEELNQEKYSITRDDINYFDTVDVSKDGKSFNEEKGNSQMVDVSSDRNLFDKAREKILDPKGPQKDLIEDTREGPKISSNVSKDRDVSDRGEGLALRSSKVQKNDLKFGSMLSNGTNDFDT